MKRVFTCIECPKSCSIAADIENCRVVKTEGAKCPKGEKYVSSEAEDPARILTSAVLAEGLAIRMAPVRTDRPIPKARMMEAMEAIKGVRLKAPRRVGEPVLEDLLGLGIKVIVTRDIA